MAEAKGHLVRHTVVLIAEEVCCIRLYHLSLSYSPLMFARGRFPMKTHSSTPVQFVHGAGIGHARDAKRAMSLPMRLVR